MNHQDRNAFQSMFSPAVTLLNRMGYSKKLTLLWVLSLVAIAVMMYGLLVSLNRVIQPSKRQLEGLTLIEPLSRTVQLLQLHRGLSAASRGNQALRDSRRAKQAEITQAIRAMNQVSSSGTLASGGMERFREKWAQLSSEGPDWARDVEFAKHTQLIEAIHASELSIADEYGLILDPEITTFYLIDTAINKVPDALEYLGQLRAFGTIALTDKSLTEFQKAKLNALLVEFNSKFRELGVNVEKVSRNRPDLKESLSKAYERIAVSGQQITALVSSDILAGHFANSPEAFLNIATVEIDHGYLQLHQILLPTARALIEARISKAELALLLTAGGAFFLFLLMVYMAVGTYYAIICNIRSLVNSANALAKGDFDRRVTLDAHDELSLVGESLNRMADGFTALLQERTKTQNVLAESQGRLSAIIDSALDAVVQMDGAGIISGWNVQAQVIFGWSCAEVLGRSVHDTIVPPRYREAHVNGLTRFLGGGTGQIMNTRTEISGLHKNGHEFPIELTVTHITVGNGYEFSAFIRDITQKKQSEELIWRQANFDVLTGLPNRHMLFDRLGQEIKKSERTTIPLALLYIDLDHFKVVNDTLGHSKGDMLLLEAARRLESCVRETDTVARMGGDEFVIILTELNEVKRIDSLAQSILDALEKSFSLEGEKVFVSASIGITLFPHDATAFEELIQSADQAMYAAKGTGRNRYCYFTQSMQQAAQSRRRMTTDLHTALVPCQFEVYYQPILDFATNRVVKAEALIRWQHPARGLISPAEFVPLAEETGLIIAIGDWVFREAVRQVKRWRAMYDPQFQISVNMSPVQFHSVDSPGLTWIGYLREHELPGQSIVIEITEGLLLDENAKVKERLQQFHAAGVKISLDDFGTGYSSLSYLQKFDIDYLKIDQSFTSRLEQESSSMALCDTIIMLAHRLNMEVVAEGVETQAQSSMLAAAGCNYGQGYLFSKPVPAGQFEELLRMDPTFSFGQKRV